MSLRIRGLCIYLLLGNLEILDVLIIDDLTFQGVDQLEALNPDFVNILVFTLFERHDRVWVLVYPIELVHDVYGIDFLLPSLIDFHDFIDLILRKWLLLIDILQRLAEHSDASGRLHDIIHDFVGLIFLVFQVLHLVWEHVFHFVLVIDDIRGQLFLNLLEIMFPFLLELVDLIKLGNHLLQIVFLLLHFYR